MNYKAKTVRIFNKYFSSFLKEMKEINEDVRQLIKTSYKVIDKSSSEYCDFFTINTLAELDNFKNKRFDDLKDCLIAKDITLGYILDRSDIENTNVIFSYIFILLLFSYMNRLEDEDELFNQVLKLISHIQNDSAEYDTDKEDLIDDDIKVMLDLFKEYGSKTQVDINKEKQSVDPMSVFESLNSSKIANLAKEISKDIDLSGVNTEKPDEMLKNMFDFSGNNNMLGNIIQKVSTTLTDKISSGELRHDELIGEAMSMMNMFGGGGGKNPLASNPLFSQMMKSMKSGKAGVKQDVLKKGDTRERLRRKLETRKKNVE